MSHYKSLTRQPEDPIFGIVPLFLADRREEKINLSVGAYKNEEGMTTVLESVREAEKILLENKLPKNYLPISGDPEFCRLTEELIYSNDLDYLKGRAINSVQTIGASGALRLGAEFLKLAGVEKIAISNPSWANHQALMGNGGLEVIHYSYYDPVKKSIDIEAMIQSIEALPENCALLFHACCHNPTGCDLDLKEWKRLSFIVKKRGLLPFFDCAYHGFKEGLDSDIEPIRLFAGEGHDLLVAYSFSKNMGLYGERVGTLSCVSESIEKADIIQSNFKKLIRACYSSPPIHSAKVPLVILSDQTLKNQWVMEVDAMRSRIISVRQLLIDKLAARGKEECYRFLKKQSGMFSFTGLTKEQVMRMKEEFAIYMPASGRINVAGLNSRNIDHFVEALIEVGTA